MEKVFITIFKNIDTKCQLRKLKPITPGQRFRGYANGFDITTGKAGEKLLLEKKILEVKKQSR
jgi:hypothetical protein